MQTSPLPHICHSKDLLKLTRVGKAVQRYQCVVCLREWNIRWSATVREARAAAHITCNGVTVQFFPKGKMKPVFKRKGGKNGNA